MKGAIVEHCACPRVRHRHGTSTAYNQCRCRCETCRKANRDKERLRQLAHLSGRALMVDAVGVRRRLQALHAMGWSGTLIAEALGIQESQYLALKSRAQVRAATHAAVAAVYDDLWDKSPPRGTLYERRAASHAANTARRKGWPGPLAWDDDTIDDPNAHPAGVSLIAGDRRADDVDDVNVRRAIAGRREPGDPPLTRAERHQVVTRLHADGRSDTEIAALTGTTDRTVLRDRQLLGLPGNALGVAS